jgi:hypothetical protein
VNVIFCPVDTIEVTVFVSYYAGNVLVQFSAIGFINRWLAILCSENNLVKNLPIVAHDFLFIILNI